MPAEGPSESAFTDAQLRAYAAQNIDDPELLRKMDEDFLENPSGEVAQYLNRMQTMTERSLDIDAERLISDQNSQTREVLDDEERE